MSDMSALLTKREIKMAGYLIGQVLFCVFYGLRRSRGPPNKFGQ